MKLVLSSKLKSKLKKWDEFLSNSSARFQEMPTPGRSANQAQDFWGSFSEMMDSSPENAWKYLSQAPQGALQAKALVQDL